MAEGNEITRKILLLSCSNLLWGLIPWPASVLFENYSSFLIIFTRFLMMSIIILCTVGIIILIDRNRHASAQSSFKMSQLWQYVRGKNVEFFNLPQWAYLLIIAILGLNSMTLLFFWGLKSIGAIVTSIGVILSLLIVTAINWGVGKESMSKFKALYLVTLIGAAIILGIVSSTSSDTAPQTGQFEWGSLIILITYSIALSFFVISSGRDKPATSEYLSIRNTAHYQLIRTFFKLGILSGFAVLSFIPMVYILSILPINPEIQAESILFFSQLPRWWEIVVNPHGLFLIIGCTIVPYFIFYVLAVNWPKHTSFDLWVGVLQLSEPIINIILGITVLEEDFPLSWLMIIIFLMLIAVLTRYLSETETTIFAIFLLKINFQAKLPVMKKAFTFKAVKQIQSLTGEHDLLLDTQFHSAKHFNRFIQKQLIPLTGLEKYELLMITGQELDRNI